MFDLVELILGLNFNLKVSILNNDFAICFIMVNWSCINNNLQGNF
jgi:hypothetical protein